ncbi:MAG: cell division protein FtsL [Pseudomonadota bacterium]
MRVVITLAATLGMVGLGYWAYSQSLETQASLDAVADLQEQIGAERERLEKLQDEWAYLNRPDRLRALADLNFDRLQLIQMTPQHFGDVTEVPAPPPTDAIADAILADILQSSASLRVERAQ